MEAIGPRYGTESSGLPLRFAPNLDDLSASGTLVLISPERPRETSNLSPEPAPKLTRQRRPLGTDQRF